jgi:hypothetical protein
VLRLGEELHGEVLMTDRQDLQAWEAAGCTTLEGALALLEKTRREHGLEVEELQRRIEGLTAGLARAEQDARRFEGHWRGTVETLQAGKAMLRELLETSLLPPSWHDRVDAFVHPRLPQIGGR